MNFAHTLKTKHDRSASYADQKLPNDWFPFVVTTKHWNKCYSKWAVFDYKILIIDMLEMFSEAIFPLTLRMPSDPIILMA